jgi:hypothetical protein
VGLFPKSSSLGLKDLTQNKRQSRDDGIEVANSVTASLVIERDAEAISPAGVSLWVVQAHGRISSIYSSRRAAVGEDAFNATDRDRRAAAIGYRDSHTF